MTQIRFFGRDLVAASQSPPGTPAESQASSEGRWQNAPTTTDPAVHRPADERATETAFGCSYRPLKRGSRFSTKAAIPSFWSSDENIIEKSRASVSRFVR
jgi:hypothetical protein